MSDKLSDSALDRIFRTARSYNGYLQDTFAEADARAIYDLLKMGPTSVNQHPARFVWCLSVGARDDLARCADPKNADKIRNAPAAVIIASDNDFHDHLPDLFPHVDARPWFSNALARKESAFRNGTLQGAYLLIAARSLGFDIGPISGFDPAKVNSRFFANRPHIEANFIVTIGRGDPSSVFPRLPRPAFERFNQAL